MSNILPKKSWHVLNQDNIDKVRKDEARHAEEQRTKEQRRRESESDERYAVLRKKAGIPSKTEPTATRTDQSGPPRPARDPSSTRDVETFGHLKASPRWYEQERAASTTASRARSELKRIEVEDPLAIMKRAKESKRTRR